MRFLNHRFWKVVYFKKYEMLTGCPTKVKKPDVLGMFLNFCVPLTASYPYFILIFGLYFAMDPLGMVYKYWIPPQLRDMTVFQVSWGCGRLLQMIPATMLFHLLCKAILMATWYSRRFSTAFRVLAEGRKISAIWAQELKSWHGIKVWKLVSG